MAHLNTQTGLWEDDENGPAPVQAGAVGAQAAIPPNPAIPTATVGEPTMISPAAAEAPGQTIPDTMSNNAAQQDAPIQPYVPQTPVLPKADRVVSPEERANLEQIGNNDAATATSATQAGAVHKDAAQAQLDAAIREDALRLQHEQERNEIADKADRAVAQETTRAKAQYDEYVKAQNDPAAPKSFGQSVLAAIAIGLGQYSAGMTGGRNVALDIINANDQNIERQKAAVEKRMKDAAGEAKGDVEALRKERTEALRELDLKHAANLTRDALKLRTELARIGLSKAQIDTNQDVQKIEADALQKRENVFASIRGQEVELAKADILASAKKAQALRKGAGGGSGPSGAADVGAKLADYATAHPGDQAGLYRLAGELKVPDKQVPKAVEAAMKNKPTESQTKGAEFGAAGLRAVDALQKTKYVPNEKDAQKWLDNQREVYRAEKASESGALGVIGASLAQKAGIVAKSEVDGLSPEAAEYFANVRRLMEPLGRAKSGAAISQSEWTNFFNQYGPRSKGGFDAARNDLNDMYRLSGVAGRQLDAGKAAPKGDGGGGTKKEPTERERAQSVRDDPSKWSRLSADQKARLTKYLKGQ
jgi:hypothetical protein